jgi:phosphoglycolate phosphatase-like HAD superfamily hydrolase
MTNDDLVAVLRTARAVLFDFDGPVCSVFAGLPAPTVARRLRQSLEDSTGGSLDVAAPEADDPMEVLRLAPSLGPDVARVADDLLTAAETEAVGSAATTPGGHCSLRACATTGRRTGIVSNNSGTAVRAYLTRHDLAHLVDAIVGRAYAEPHLMKPDPGPITTALHSLGIEPGVAVLVGDSATDIGAARAAGVACIGYANKPGKRDLLAGADAVVENMQVLADHLARVPVVAPR